MQEAFEIEAKKLGLDLRKAAGYRADPETGNIERGFYRGWQAALASQQEAEPATIWLGEGDKLISDIFDREEGKWIGVGVFNSPRKLEVGEFSVETFGKDISELDPITLIKTTNPDSLRVIIAACERSLSRVDTDAYPSPTAQDSKVPAKEDLREIFNKYITAEYPAMNEHYRFEHFYKAMLSAAPSVAEKAEWPTAMQTEPPEGVDLIILADHAGYGPWIGRWNAILQIFSVAQPSDINSLGANCLWREIDYTGLQRPLPPEGE